MKTNTKKLLSLLLALMMMLTVVPFYASAAAEALTQANVTQWPTISYKNGQTTVYYGQTQEMALTINDDELVTDSAGNIVAGHFEFNNPDNIPNAGSTAKKATIVFVPDDTTMYTGFKKSFSPATYYVEKVTPVLKDENNPPVVAEAVEAGTALSSVTISGGDMINPYNAELDLATSWAWSNPDTVITESGEYEAVFDANRVNYTTITRNIYVEVKAPEIPFAQITELPAVEGLVYDSNRTWADVKLTGGKADVEGTFAITKIMDWDMSYWNTQGVGAGTWSNVEVTFTPDDLTVAQPTKTTITVEVAKAPFKFLDENGAEITPEITVPYGTAYKDLGYSLKAFKTNVTSSQGYDLRFENEKLTIPVGENEIDVTVVPYGDNNVETATVKVKVTVEPREITISSVAYSHVGGFMVITPDYQVKGTFDVYANDTLIGKDLAIVGYDFKCDFAPEASGEYAIRIVYNPTDADPCTMEDYEANVQINLKRNITLAKGTMRVNGSATQSNIKAGDVISIQKIIAADEIAAWIIKDANGNEVTIDGVDLTAEEITFTMPDCDLNITYKTQKEVEREEAAANCDHLCHSDNFLAKIIWKMLNIIFRLFDIQQYCDCGNLHYDAPIFG